MTLAVTLEIAHVAVWQWRPQGGAPIPNYLLGPGRNATKPDAFHAKRAARNKLREHQARAKPFALLTQAVAEWRPA